MNGSTDQRQWQQQFDSDEARWQAVLARTNAADGQFFYAVRSTGIYCYPSCPARHPRRANVTFFGQREQAEAAGFRACLRCKSSGPPLVERQQLAVISACRLIEQALEAPDLAALAAAVGLSRFHFHRVFKAHTGMTPQAYVRAQRANRLRQQLAGAGSVTEAIFDAGFGSSTRFYAGADNALGMAPRQYRAAGQGESIHYAFGSSSLGVVLVAATSRGICAILMGDTEAPLLEELRQRFARATLAPAEPAFARVVQQVLALIEQPANSSALPLDVRGTVFQQRVWQALRSIPAGTTLSYAELAAQIGVAGGARAVAAACAANALAVIIPCHRVVRGSGALAGYRWGIERKRALLAREQAQVPDAAGDLLAMPKD